MVDNYIHRFLKLTDQENLAEGFNLMPFSITTQAIKRTLIEKVYAICDYYLLGKAERYSRHLYDIYKIMEYGVPDESITELVQEVRRLREPLPICPSAGKDVCINNVLAEIIEKNVYQRDYKTITGNLLFTYLPYQAAMKSLKTIIENGYFQYLRKTLFENEE